ncbi:MAG: hybrid sensor histidine kinase/response regulator [Pseudomonadota bacterium]
MLTLLNVTERQQMETALRERDARLERFKTTLDLTLDCVFMFDADDLRIFYANQGACDHVGLDADQLRGMHVYDLKPDYPEARFRELIEPLQQGQQTSLTLETVHQRSDGDTIPVEVFLQRIAPDGEPARFVAIVRDIRERVAARETLQRNEQELQRLNQSLEAEVAARTRELEHENRRNQAILQSTPEGFFAVDADGAMHDVNPAFCRMLGYHATELLEMSLVDIEASETPDEIAAHIERVAARGHDRFDSRHRRRDGRVIDVEVSVTRVDFDHQPMFYAFTRDITWRKELETALVRSRDQAEQASAAKSEFLSRMSHELRTPLNAILGFSQLLEQDAREPPSPTQRDEIREIHSAGEHLLELVNEVLDLARIESGRLEVRLEPVELEPMVHTCLVQLQTILSERNLNTQVDLTGAGALQADPLRLRQILTNLLTNAAKYNHAGGTIRIDCAPDRERVLSVRVHDTGPGIAPEDTVRVFQPFERLDASADNSEGTGIGLALTRRLVEAMGGRIGVESTPGEGSSFWFELPLADTVAQTPGPDRADPAPDSGLPAAQRTVLYVEDNPANLRLVERILEARPGFHLLQATDGETGLQIARTQRPDLILMDLHLPGMDGIQALRELRADPGTRDITVIAVSANAMPRDLEMGRSAGFADYVTKPIQIGIFLELLERHLSDSEPTP